MEEGFVAGMKQKSYYVHTRTDLLGLIPKDAKRILDVGCGEGILGRQIKESADGIEVIGVEKDEGSYKTAVKKTGQRHSGRY